MMQNNDLPELDPALDNIVKLERRKNSLVMTYSFRSFLLWIFLSLTTWDCNQALQVLRTTAPLFRDVSGWVTWAPGVPHVYLIDRWLLVY